MEGFKEIESGLDEVIAFDPKRKHVEENVRRENNKKSDMISLDNGLMIGLKK